MVKIIVFLLLLPSFIWASGDITYIPYKNCKLIQPTVENLATLYNMTPKDFRDEITLNGNYKFVQIDLGAEWYAPIQGDSYHEIIKGANSVCWIWNNFEDIDYHPFDYITAKLKYFYITSENGSDYYRFTYGDQKFIIQLTHDKGFSMCKIYKQ